MNFMYAMKDQLTLLPALAYNHAYGVLRILGKRFLDTLNSFLRCSTFSSLLESL